MAQEKPARRLVDQRGRRSRTLYRKLNKSKCKYTRCNSAVSILRIDTAELHRVYDNMLQRAQKCIDVQDHFQHLL